MSEDAKKRKNEEEKAAEDTMNTIVDIQKSSEDTINTVVGLESGDVTQQDTINTIVGMESGDATQQDTINTVVGLESGDATQQDTINTVVGLESDNATQQNTVNTIVDIPSGFANTINDPTTQNTVGTIVDIPSQVKNPTAQNTVNTIVDTPSVSGGSHGKSEKRYPETKKDTYSQTRSVKDAQIHLEDEQRYENIKILGKGGMGVVKLVKDTTIGRKVAMKVVRGKQHSSSLKRFIKEAQITGQLEHPNIIPIYDLLMSKTPYFTMKMVKGQTLSDIIKGLKKGDEKYKEYTIIKLVQIMQGICYALEFAHDKDIVHRDLKPDNIMVGEFGEILVLDWGLAKHIASEEITDKTESTTTIEVNETVAGSIVGTPRYMSPEQAQGKTELIGKATDIYALGTILYEMVTYEATFECKNVHQLLHKVIHEEVEHKKQNLRKEPIPKEIMAIALKAVSKKMEDRYDSIRAFRDDLQCFLEGKTVSASPDTLFEKSVKLVKRYPGISISIATAFFILLFVYHIFEMRISSEKLKNHFSMNQKQQTIKRWSQNAAEMEKTIAISYGKKEVLAKKLGDTESEEKIIFIRNRLLSIEEDIARETKNLVDIYLRILELNNTQKYRVKLARIYLKNARELLFTQNKTLYPRIENILKEVTKLAPTLKDQVEKIERQLRVKSHVEIVCIDSQKQLSLFQFQKTAQGKFESYFLKKIPLKKQNLKLDSGSYFFTIKELNFIFPFQVGFDESITLNLKIPKNIPKNMAYIPKGKFLSGPQIIGDYLSRKGETADFFIDKTEVTIKDYLVFYKDNENEKYLPKILLPSGKYESLWDEDFRLKFGLKENFPIFGITYESAKAFCKWRSEITGLRFDLPMVAEWEKASRGVDGRFFPWGNVINENYANVAQGLKLSKICAVRSYQKDKSVYGLFDMVGNLSEWTSTSKDGKIIVKGSNFSSSIDYGKAYISIKLSPDTRSYVGFRCVCRTIRY